MISKSVYESTSVSDLVKNLISAGVKLDLACDGPLNELVRCASPGNIATFMSDVGHNFASQELINLAINDDGDVIKSEHTTIINAGVELISNSMRSVKLITQQQALPLIEEIVANIEEKINASEPNRGIALSVKPITYSDIWKSSHLNALISSYDKPYHEISKYYEENFSQHPERNLQQLAELVKTGASGYDALITQWLDEGGMAEIETAYTDHFMIGGKRGELPGVHDIKEKDRHLAIYLLAVGLQKDIDSTVRVSAGEFKLRMASLAHGAGHAMNRIIANDIKMVKEGRMVYAYPPASLESNIRRADEAVIPVNKVLYDRWLSEGGDVDTLMGCYLNGRELTIATINAKAGYKAELWRKRAKMIVMDSIHLRDAEIRDEIVNSITQIINNSEEEIYQRFTKASMHKALKMMSRKINKMDLSDVYDTVKDMVCSILFADTSVKMFINEMEAIAKVNPDLEAREIATMAEIEIMAIYLMEQITVIK